MDFTVDLGVPFSLDYTLESGQVFRWERKGGWWYGVVAGGVLKVRQEGSSMTCSTSSPLLDIAFVRNYFRLDEDLDPVVSCIAKDRTISTAVEKFYGLRIIRQERWECLASFLLATNANIPRIKKMVAAICARYGEGAMFEGTQYNLFPRPESLASAPLADLRACGLGYRAPFLKHVSKSVVDGKVDFSELSALDYEKSRKLLLTELLGEKTLLGVGPKVADCVLLYSWGKEEAFPIDVWIARALVSSYPRMLPPPLRRKLARESGVKISGGDYDTISKAARKYFGKFAGYAQLYLYVSARAGSV